MIARVFFEGETISHVPLLRLAAVSLILLFNLLIYSRFRGRNHRFILPGQLGGDSRREMQWFGNQWVVGKQLGLSLCRESTLQQFGEGSQRPEEPPDFR
jgi:hypothetical protein